MSRVATARKPLGPTTGRVKFGALVALDTPVVSEHVKVPFTHAFQVPGQNDQLFTTSEARKTVKLWSELGWLLA